MKRSMLRLALLTMAVTSPRCLAVETTHRLYLSPSGAVTWSVQESDVHSDDRAAATRASEEAGFVSGVHGGSHPALLGLEQIGGASSGSRLVRRERPFEVRTTARFAAADLLAAAILRELNADGEATLQRQGSQTTLTVVVRDGVPDTYEGPLLALVDDPAAYRIVLTEGRFTRSEGFAISADGRSATPVEREGPGTGEWRLSLTWDAR